MSKFSDPEIASEAALTAAAAEQEKALIAFGESIVAMLPKWVPHALVQHGELVLHTPVDHVYEVIEFLQLHSNAEFTNVTDLTAVDYPEREKRFEVVYNLLSVNHNARIRVKTFVDALTPVPSIVPLHNGANWFERETWDMYGIFFAGHPDLRRILTDYGFEGYPMRRDFPLSGYVEVRYDDELKQVVVEDLELTQEFRNFDFKSPFEQIPAAPHATPKIASSHITRISAPDAAEQKEA